MKVLLVEDNRGDARLIREMLGEGEAGQFDLSHVENLAAALKYLGETSVDVVLLDLSLPDSHGLDTFIKIHNQVPAIPVVVMSGFSDESFAVEAVRYGAQDYLTKGKTDSNLLMRALRYAIERKRMEQELKDREEKLRLMFQSMDDMIVVMDLKGDIVDVNEATVRTLGYGNKDDLIGRSSAELVVEGYRDEAIKMAVEAIKKGPHDDRSEYQYLRLRTAGGDELEAEYGINLIRDAAGSIRGVLGISRDITERKRQEQALRASEEKLRLTLASIRDGLIVTDLGGNIIDINDEAIRMVGYENREELIGRNVLDFVTRKDSIRIAEDFAMAVEQRLTLRMAEYSFVSKNGREFYVEASAKMLRDRVGDATGFVAIIRDITQRKQADEAIQQRNRELTAMNTISQSLSRQVKLNDVLQTALDTTLEVMSLPAGGIWLIDEEKQKLALTVHKGVCEKFAVAAKNVPIGESVTGEAVERGKVTVTVDMCEDMRVPHTHKTIANLDDLRDFISVPLRSKGKTLGVMNIFDREPRDFPEKDIRLLETIGGQIGVAIENAQLLEKLSELSITDKLTGLYNRRHFYEVLESEINRTRRYRQSFCMVMIDLDGFKLYNDIYGHVNGDDVLKDFAQALKTAVRKTDPVFRYGGDEFAIIFPSTDVERAGRIIERIRAQWPSTSKDISATLETPLGFSAGIAQFPEDIDTLDGLIFMADAALLQAKRAGKYRTELASKLEQHERES